MAADTRHVAFFRNLNLGQRRSPTRTQLLDAFGAAGASTAESVQVNGTVAFSAADPIRVGRSVCAALTPLCGYSDIAVVRSVPWVLELGLRLRANPEVDPAGSAEVSLFDASGAFPHPLPWRPDGRLATVVAADSRHAVVLNDEPARSNGTFLLERLLGVPVTSRSVRTWLRLADRCDPARGTNLSA